MADVELIDKERLETFLNDWMLNVSGDGYEKMSKRKQARYDTLEQVFDAVSRFPTIGPESLRPAACWKPSVGEWVHVDGSGEVWSEPAVECSKCGGIISQSDHDSYVWNYCPVCGAKMENESDQPDL